MKTRYIGIAILFALAVTTAHAASWTPQGGQPQTPAPDSQYMGDLQLVVIGDTEIIQIITTDPAGILTIEREDCSQAEWDALYGAAPGSGTAEVVINNSDPNGAVAGVIVH